MNSLGPLLALLLLAAAPQEAEVRDLLRRLEDDDAEVREKAQKQMGLLGERAIPLLKEAADSPRSAGEVRLRLLAAIREIELSGKISKVFQEPKPIALRASDTTLREVLDELSRQAGVAIDSSQVDGAAKVAIDVKDAPLQRVLDLLCADQPERTWEALDDGAIRFLKERHPAAPAVYGGPFRLRIQSLNVERGTDFKGKTASATVTLAADWDRRLKPSKIVEIDLAKASDGLDSALEISAADAGVVVVRGVPGAQLRVAGMNFPEPGENVRTFSLKNLSPAATRIDLEGVARFTFPLDYKDVRFEKPGPGGHDGARLEGRGHRDLDAVVPQEPVGHDAVLVADDRPALRCRLVRRGRRGRERVHGDHAPAQPRPAAGPDVGRQRLVPDRDPAELDRGRQGGALPLRRADTGEDASLQVHRPGAALTRRPGPPGPAGTFRAHLRGQAAGTRREWPA